MRNSLGGVVRPDCPSGQHVCVFVSPPRRALEVQPSKPFPLPANKAWLSHSKYSHLYLTNSGTKYPWRQRLRNSSYIVLCGNDVVGARGTGVRADGPSQAFPQTQAATLSVVNAPHQVPCVIGSYPDAVDVGACT